MKDFPNGTLMVFGQYRGQCIRMHAAYNPSHLCVEGQYEDTSILIYTKY